MMDFINYECIEMGATTAFGRGEQAICRGIYPCENKR
jgi:hypothetical protein